MCTLKFLKKMKSEFFWSYIINVGNSCVYHSASLFSLEGVLVAAQEWQRHFAILDFALIFPMMFVVVAKITYCVRVVWSGHQCSSVVKHKHSRVCHLWLNQILGFFFLATKPYQKVLKDPNCCFSRSPEIQHPDNRRLWYHADESLSECVSNL